MGQIVVVESLTLDGVMQAPGRPDEDTRGGFTHGGWAIPYADPAMGERMGTAMDGTGALLLGRRTFADFAGYWPFQGDNPYTTALTNTVKYVASRTMTAAPAWQNSELIDGDAVAAAPRIAAEYGGDIVILGSGELVRSLHRHRLIDRYLLMIHPLVLGGGRRLFDDDGRLAGLELLNCETTGTGVMMGTFRPTEGTAR